MKTRNRIFCLVLLGAVAAGCGNSNGGYTPSTQSAGCVELRACCAEIKDATQSQSCVNAANTYQGLTNSDAACQSATQQYRAAGLCAAGGGSGGAGGQAGGLSCNDLSACCNTMSDATIKQGCQAVVNTYQGTANADIGCGAALRDYQTANLCASNVGGAGGGAGTGAAGTGGVGGAGGGTSGSGGAGGSAGGVAGSSGGSGECKVGGLGCQTYDQCCSGVCANWICTSCTAQDGLCASGGGCCKGLICYQDKCSSCKADGDSCTYPSDCCSHICNEKACERCHSQGEPCSVQSQCCDGFTCNGTNCIRSENTDSLCADGIDNEMNGHTDCEDWSCCKAGVPAPGITVCPVGTCGGGSSTNENTNALCSDGIDNDNNGHKDCDDYSCCKAGVPSPGITVCPSGTCGGGGSTGDKETTDALCSDGIDNDNNGHKDCDDYSCCMHGVPAAGITVCIAGSCGGGTVPPENTDASCMDGEDNDGDGYTDCADYSCCKAGVPAPGITVCTAGSCG